MDGQTDGEVDGGDNNIPDTFSKKRGDNYSIYVLILVMLNKLRCHALF